MSVEGFEKRIHELEVWAYKSHHLLDTHSKLWERYIPVIEDAQFKAAVANETNKIKTAAREEGWSRRTRIIAVIAVGATILGAIFPGLNLVLTHF